MTLQDLQNILQLIASDRLSLRGNEAVVVAALIRRIEATIQAAKEPPSGDSPRPTE